jgi:O-antigen ligase
MIRKIVNWSSASLAILSLGAASLAIGIGLQAQSPGFVVRALGFIGFWIIWIALKGINLRRCLIMVSSMYLLPFEFALYFALALLLLVMVADIKHKDQRQFLIPYPISFLVLTVFGLISLSRSYVEGSSLYFIASIVIPLFSFLVIGNSRKDKPALDIWMRAISIVAIMVAIYGIYIALANPGKRIGSTWSNAMTINGFYALAFFFCLALFFKTPFLVKRIFWLFAACIIFLGMLFTYTRMAMLAIVFGMLLMMYKNKRIRLWGIFAIALIPLIIPSAMLDRGETNSLIDISIFIRLIAWYNATSVILENPVFGIGFSTWKEIYHDMVPLPVLYAQHAHNVYINLLLEIGFFGTLAYLNIIFKSLRRYYIEAVKPGGDMVSYSIWVGMLSLLFSCLTDIFIQQYTVSLLFWITLALMVKEGKMNGELAGETEILQK